jgi:hypothetical protein
MRYGSVMPSTRSLLTGESAESRGVRAAFGGISGFVAALVAFHVAHSFVMRALLVGVLVVAFTTALSVVYSRLRGFGTATSSD